MKIEMLADAAITRHALAGRRCSERDCPRSPTAQWDDEDGSRLVCTECGRTLIAAAIVVLNAQPKAARKKARR